MLIEFLLSDLERFYHFNGQSGRTPRRRELWRNFLIPRCAPVALYRVASTAQRRGWSRLAKIMTWVNFYLHGVEISAHTRIGSHFYMPHVSGTVIGAKAIGSFVVIYHQVTLGAQTVEFEHAGRPTIGDRVIIGSGAKVLGEVEVGDGCRIGANAVVTKSFEGEQLLLGIPATAQNLP